MTKESNITETKDGLMEKSSGRKIVSPLDFFFIDDKKPPIGIPILIRLFDKWRPGNEVEIDLATYDGENFIHHKTKRPIRKNFVTGWRYQSQS